MPEYKLIYFNGRGLAELSRWIMHYGGIPFTDERVEKEDWPEKKKTVPGGKLPVLEIDGKPLPQSLAIARFLAKKAGLLPEDPLQEAYCDALIETLRDVVVDVARIKMAEGKSEEEKEKTLKEEYVPNTLEPLLQRLEKRFTEKQWFVSDKITWADIAIGRIMEGFYKQLPDVVEKYPKLKAHADKILNLPKIKEWIQRRPETPF